MAKVEQSEQTEPSFLIRSYSDGVAILTLNRPSARNSLSTGLISALQAELDAIRNNDSVRVVVIAAVGEVFCAGHDLREMIIHVFLFSDSRVSVFRLAGLPIPTPSH